MKLLLPRVHLATTGQHIDASGKYAPITKEDLLEIVESHDNSKHTPPLVLGHSGDDPRRVPKNDSQPRFGFPDKLYVEEDPATGKANLYGDLKITPQMAELIDSGLYASRSISFYPEDSIVNPSPGKKHLRHIAMLGGVPPAIKGLEDIIEFAEESSVVTTTTEEDFYDGSNLIDLTTLPESELAEKQKNCWKGYERTPGTKPGTKGSCRKKGTNMMEVPTNMDLGEKIKLMERSLMEKRKSYQESPSQELMEMIDSEETQLKEMKFKLGQSPASDAQQKELKPTIPPVVDRTKNFQEGDAMPMAEDSPEKRLMDEQSESFIRAILTEGEEGVSGEIISFEPKPSIDNNYLLNPDTGLMEGTFLDEDGEAFNFSIDTNSKTKSFSPVNKQEEGEETQLGEMDMYLMEAQKEKPVMSPGEMQIVNEGEESEYREDPLVTEAVAQGIVQSDMNLTPSMKVRETEAETALANAEREKNYALAEENKMLQQQVKQMQEQMNGMNTLMMEMKRNKIREFAAKAYSEGKVSQGTITEDKLVSFMEALSNIDESVVSYSEGGEDKTQKLLPCFQEFIENQVPVVQFGEIYGTDSDRYYNPDETRLNNAPGIVFDPESDREYLDIIQFSESNPNLGLNPDLAPDFLELSKLYAEKTNK